MNILSGGENKKKELENSNLRHTYSHFEYFK